MIARLVRTPLTWVVVAVLVAGGVAGLYWFQPWKLVTDRTVDEALSSPGPAPTASGSTQADTAAPGSTLLAQGRFISHEHETSGAVRIVRAADGVRRLELVDLATSNGPDLRVWLTDRPVVPGTAGWRVFDDGAYVELGRLKGNRGNQAYDIPASVDLARYVSVSIWCGRFAVSFGAAQLTPG